MAEFSRPDLCIIGAGALGIALALQARQLGASVVLADRGAPEPGDQPQRALRTAALSASAGFVGGLRRGASLGLGSVEAKISFKGIQERVSQVVLDRAVLDSKERLAALDIDVLSGHVQFVDPKMVQVGEAQLRPRHVIIATGGKPVVPEIPGLEDIAFFDTDSIYLNLRKLTHLLVIGGDAEAFVLAQAHRRLGSEVTLVPQGGILPGHDAESVDLLLQALEAEGLKIIRDGTVRAIQPRAQGTGVMLAHDNGTSETLDVSHVLVSMGRVADIGGIGAEKARLRPVPGGVANYAAGSLGQTSNRMVRVVGAAAGIEQWHQALAHGRAVVESVIVGGTRQKVPVQPRLVMTEPALAQIGMLPGMDGKAKPSRVLVRANFSENDKARAMGLGHGSARIVASADGQVLGASVIGPDAGELAGVLALAMGKRVTLADMADLAVPHPSLMGMLVTLGENYLALRPVSSWTAQARKLRRMLPW